MLARAEKRYLQMDGLAEIGIRMALGAQRWQVVRLVLMENAWIAAAGAVMGLGVALVFAKMLKSFLYEIAPTDPWVLLASALLLGVVACAASLVPAVRAARIDPMDAIRCE
jgi:ABC-type antimicrobial peptide transport system permease subunit